MYAKFRKSWTRGTRSRARCGRRASNCPRWTSASQGRADDPGYGLVELGVCAAPVAHALAR